MARKALEHEAEIDRLTVAVNVGTLITHDRDALRKWRASHRTHNPDPSQFTATVSRLAARFPDKVKTH